MTQIVRKHQTFAARSLSRLVLVALVAGVVLLGTRPAHAAGTPEQTCQKGRYDAAAKYSACQQKALAKYYASADLNSDTDVYKYRVASGKCQTKYTAVWPKLQAKAPGSFCDTARFTDYGTTVEDNLTGLQWEKKTNDATIHDKDNYYSWNNGEPPYVAADGTAFTTFLPAFGCFAGQCDWRLPTTYELQTILLAPYPCATRPCIDPVFGPTVANYYCSTTTNATSPTLMWNVNFRDGDVPFDSKDSGSYGRGVRGGL